MNWKIIRADAGMIEEIANLEKICFSDPWSENSIKSEIENPDSYFTAAVSGEKVIGFCIIRYFAYDAELLNIAVLPEERKNGVGEAMLRDAAAKALENGSKMMFLEVRDSNVPAQKFYKKLGFIPVGRRKNYYIAPREDAVLMRLEISV